MKRILVIGAAIATGLGIASPNTVAAEESHQLASISSIAEGTASSDLTPGWSQGEPNVETRIRLALTYGETSGNEAAECAARLNRVEGGNNLKMAVPETCAWLPISGEEVSQAWKESWRHPIITASALLTRTLSLIISLLNFPFKVLSS